MLVSIVTASFNSANTITDTLNSILNQSYDRIECIIVDGESKDATAQIVENFRGQYPNRIIKWESERDQGIYDALNKGIGRATGDIIGFVHSDDMLASNNVIETIVNTIVENQTDGVYGDLKYVKHSNIMKTVRYWTSNSYNRKLLKQGWMPPHPTVFLKRSVYDDIGGFDTTFKIAADYDFLLRLFSTDRFILNYIPETVTIMRIGGTSNQSLKNIIKKSREDYRALKDNNVGGLWSLFLKNSSKLSQFWLR